MLAMAIWDKLPECIFGNFKIAQVKWGQFQNFQKLRGWFISKIAQTTPNQPRFYIETNLITVGSYKSVSGQLQNSGKLQNYSVNCAMSITINPVTREKI